MEDLLKRLVDSASISGYEKNIRDLISKEIKPYVDEIKIDKIGNLICKKGSGSPKVMLTAHMDEVGLMVKYIDDDGFIKFEPVGGWDPKVLLSQKFKIHGTKGPVIGVIGSKPIHLQDREDVNKVVKLNDMFIDIGAKNKKEVAAIGIRLGDFITIYGEFNKLNGSRITAHGFDDRLGCLVMIEVMKNLKKFKGTVYAVGTVKEEIGLVGVRGSAFSINPDVVISLDTTTCGDTPELKPYEAPARMGLGPVLVVKDAISIIQSEMKEWVEDVAKKNKIKIQFDILSGGATDASVTPMIREGIPSIAILTPSRYLHTPTEVADMNDVKNAVTLVTELVKSASTSI
ncbi:MAG: M42 family metallopeptidase [Candidatus Aenigmarchaeota archaeon]|nr:M42 family metallopeptidase [Candidatus Aenigmarchaeota archaeon]